MKHETPKAILIAGPTASGKSALALRLAETLGGWVINADSLQVYDGWRVLTARPDADELSRAPHFLYGHKDPAKRYSVGKWLSDLSKVLANAEANNITPVIVGGTGLNFVSLTNGLSEIPAIPETTRTEAIALQDELGHSEFKRLLLARDPKSAQLDIENPRRALRAWEVYQATGQSLIDWSAKPTVPVLQESRICAKLILNLEREALIPRINTRFHEMISGGALEEASEMRDRQLDPTLPAMRAVGAPPLFSYLNGDMTLEQAVERGAIDTRQYAKRQRTWFRNQMADWTTVNRGQVDSIFRKITSDNMLN